MKLFLSSDHLGNDPRKFLDLFSDNKNVAVISNAKDYKGLEERNEGTETEIKSLKNLGLNPREIDLRDYFGRKEELKERLNEFSAVWVRGGNTFILRRTMKESELDEILREKISDKNFIYGGYSAGSCVVTPTLKGLEFMDDPNVVPEGYKAEIIWEGLSFVDYLIVPHYQSDNSESPGAERTVRYLKENNILFKTLRDGEVIITEIV